MSTYKLNMHIASVTFISVALCIFVSLLLVRGVLLKDKMFEYKPNDLISCLDNADSKKHDQDSNNKVLSVGGGLLKRLEELETKIIAIKAEANSKSSYDSRFRYEDEGKGADNHISDSNVAQFIESDFDRNGVDQDVSDEYYSATVALLMDNPEIVVDRVRCNQNYCSALFNTVDGASPNIEEVWGNPPFMHEGFSIPQIDGGLLLYFTDDQTNIDELRSLAAEYLGESDSSY
ncbi:hypothetical protein P886_0341 [Alteromonadaceae bacterium 2753L.S.0a.02]|nr:hypothetical protein P886_0341 [Alteromonadaceae bacterium 2753L.S.0a.02]